MHCAEFIETEGIVDGIYRLSGIASNIQKLRLAFDEDRVPNLYHEKGVIQVCSFPYEVQTKEFLSSLSGTSPIPYFHIFPYGKTMRILCVCSCINTLRNFLAYKQTFYMPHPTKFTQTYNTCISKKDTQGFLYWGLYGS